MILVLSHAHLSFVNLCLFLHIHSAIIADYHLHHTFRCSNSSVIRFMVVVVAVTIAVIATFLSTLILVFLHYLKQQAL